MVDVRVERAREAAAGHGDLFDGIVGLEQILDRIAERLEQDGGGNLPAAVEEKTAFDVILTTVPADKKIQVIKVVRELTSLGLKEAKDLVEAVPKPVKTGVAKEESETMRKKLEEVGAKVEIR